MWHVLCCIMSYMTFKNVAIHNAYHLSVIVYFYQSDSGLTQFLVDLYHS